MAFWFVLNRLIRDIRGNTLALTAACIFPLLGLIGGGVDMSRIYLTKARMQQACDAGALAGRKTMGGGAWNANNNQAETAALNMFDANFRNGSYGSGNVTRAFVETAGKVTGTASTPLPMAIMRVFGFSSKTITVTCDAEMRLPNTDVMFVLDVTGSMDQLIPGDTEKKIVGLKRAVRCFYEIVARLDTMAECDGGAPSGGTSAETQIRFGFVPYDTNVNVGKLLPSNWFKDHWTYQSRERIVVYGKKTSLYSDGNYKSWSSWSNKTASAASEADCKSKYTEPTIIEQVKSGAALQTARNESTGGISGRGTWEAPQTWQIVEREFSSWNSSKKICSYKTRTRDFTRTFVFQWVASTDSEAVAFNAWRYRPVEVDLTPLKSGTGWTADSTLILPVGTTAKTNGYSTNYTDQAIKWDGCIEERKTVRASDYIPRPSDALDLDLNTPPSQFDDDTKWAPALKITYQRGTSYNDTTRNQAQIDTFYQFDAGGYSCTTAAHRLETWPDSGVFDSYVDTLTPGSNTYHDIGLIWGGRLMSPKGLFAADNAATPRGGDIQRHMIFMTDGEACTGVGNYQAYGLSWYDRRQTDDTVAPSDGCGTSGSLTQQVNARTQAACAVIKNMPNTTLWVVWFGKSNATIEGQLKKCASGDDRFFTAQSTIELQRTFRRIANQISQLRLTN